MKHIIFHNKKIVYRTEGSGNGNPVMLLHGFAEDGTIWNYQLEKLKEKFLVIIPDLPGSGQSPLLEGKIFIEDYAEVVKAIMVAELLNDQKNLFTLIGHSMGGYITLAFAEKYPGLLQAFGLFHSSAYADDDAKKESRKKGIEFIKNNGAISFLKNTSPNLFSDITKKVKPELVEQLIDLSRYFSDEALIQYYETMMQRPDRTPVLQSFNRPVLFMIGKGDNAVPLQASLEQVHLPSVAHVKILQNSGHMGLWEEKEEATLFLMNFLLQL
ncbi:MAG: alpha/beta hydrolase [Ginsengibacter sp.]